MKPIKEAHFDRTYDAPVETVWRAWTDSEQLKQWWGPSNVTIPECEIDVRVGGRFYIVMKADASMGEYAGTRWPMDATFTEVEKNAKLAYEAKAWTEGQEDATTIEQTTTIVFGQEDGKTTLHLDVAITKSGPNADAAVEGMKYGFSQQFDKLEKYLQK